MSGTPVCIPDIAAFLRGMGGNMVIGFDGFIDEVWWLLESRSDEGGFEYLERMKTFGEQIVGRGTGGLARETVIKRRSFGGFTCNTGMAAAGLGLRPALIGMYGRTEINEAFAPLSGKCELISVGDPAVCRILEFSDGKIMLPSLSNLLGFKWDILETETDFGRVGGLFDSADIICVGYWSNLLNFDDIIIRLVCDHCRGKQKRLLFDFANLSKRSPDALKKTLLQLGNLNAKVPMTLSLNEHEGKILLRNYGKGGFSDAGGALDALRDLRKRVRLDEIIIHAPGFAAGISESEGTAMIPQVYCANPAIMTGAGDTFNGGYAAACMASPFRLRFEDRLAIANAAAYLYVSNGFPPGRDALLNHLVPCGKF